MSGQVPVTALDRTVARALGVEDSQLVADTFAVLGHPLDVGDVRYAGRLWGTTPTGTLLRILEDAYPMPPAGWGLTQTTQTTTHNGATTGAAHTKGKGTSCSR